MLALLAAVLVAGCTDQPSPREQVDQINRHTTKTVEENIKPEQAQPVKKYTITDYTVEGRCYDKYNNMVGRVPEQEHDEVFERAQNVQEFNDGFALIVNGFDEFDYFLRHDCQAVHQNMTMDDYRQVTVDTEIQAITYNLSVYQNGSEIHSEQRNCPVFIEYEDGPDAHHHTDWSEVVDEIYGECFGVKR